jgi:hypothetical protein
MPIIRNAMLRHVRDCERASVQRIEGNPWIHIYRAVKAEVDRTGDDMLFEEFQQWFKKAEARRYSRKTHCKSNVSNAVPERQKRQP